MKIRIFRQHTHAGETFPAGSEIDLPDADAAFVLSIEGERRAEIVQAQAKYQTLQDAVEIR